MLSENKDAQDRLRQELRRARKEKGGQDLDYDELNELPFLDAVCRETLRLLVVFLFFCLPSRESSSCCVIRFPPVSQRFRRYVFYFKRLVSMLILTQYQNQSRHCLAARNTHKRD